MIGLSLARVDAVRTDGWRGAFPTTVLIIALPILPDTLIAGDINDEPKGALASRWLSYDDWRLGILDDRLAAAMRRTDDPQRLHRLTCVLTGAAGVRLPTGDLSPVVATLVGGITGGDAADRLAALDSGNWLIQVAQTHPDFDRDRANDAVEPHVDALLLQLANSEGMLEANLDGTRESDLAGSLLGLVTSDRDIADAVLRTLNENDSAIYGASSAIRGLVKSGALDPGSLIPRLEQGSAGAIVAIMGLFFLDDSRFDALEPEAQDRLVEFAFWWLREDSRRPVVRAAIILLQSRDRTADIAALIVEQAAGGDCDRAVLLTELLRHHVDAIMDPVLGLLSDGSPETRACGLDILLTATSHRSIELPDAATSRVLELATQPEGPLDQQAASALIQQLGLTPKTPSPKRSRDR